MDGDTVIEARGLVKRFDKKVAVNGVDLTIRKGEIYGFLGPNGAGKTTTIRMLTTMDLPTSGTILVVGHDTATDYVEARKHIGIIQQQHSLDKDISVRENIMHHALMQNLSIKESRRRTEEMAETLELTDRMEDLVSTLSGGWKKRVAIVCSMIHHPDILFMDEPTTGLDTQSRNLLWKMIRTLNKGGTTIFLTTHYIYEAEELCDRIGIIVKGEIIAEGTPEELISRIGSYAVDVSDEEGEKETSYYPDRESARTAADKVGRDLNAVVRKTSLEDVFLDLTGRQIRCTTSWARSGGSRTATSAS